MKIQIGVQNEVFKLIKIVYYSDAGVFSKLSFMTDSVKTLMKC